MEYVNFLKKYPNYSKHKIEGEKIFNLLVQEENILKMITWSIVGKPAITPIVWEIERHFDELVQNRFVRSMIGAMVSFILWHFGYIPKCGRDVKGQYFTAGSVFVKTGVIYYELQYSIKKLANYKI